MASSRRTALLVVVFTLSTCLACGDPPDKELQQAERAIDAARVKGADRYAGDDFAAAEAALKSARDAVDQRDYRLALNRALDAEARAQAAGADAETRRAAVQADADKAVSAATRALTIAQARLQAAEASRLRPRALTAPRRAIEAAERNLQEARTAFGAGDYLAARDTARGANTRLAEATRAIDSAMPPSSRRRH
jgi:hypothetical protein